MEQSGIHREIEVYSQGHFSTEGNLENELFEWGLLVDGNYCFQFFGEDVIKGERAVQFFHSIQTALPKDYEQRMMYPEHPGDGY